VKPKIKIENSKWICYDDQYYICGSTPQEAWLNYKKQKEIDKQTARMHQLLFDS